MSFNAKPSTIWRIWDRRQRGGSCVLNDRVAKLDDPRSIGESLRGPVLGAFWKYRVGDTRIIAHIDDAVLNILVVKLGHRREIYR